jgi:DNA mismatch endonuclease Vsr
LDSAHGACIKASRHVRAGEATGSGSDPRHELSPNHGMKLVDTLTVAQRSERMARIRSKDTKPEMIVRRTLHQLGYRFRLHRRDLPGAPDLVFPSRKKVIFVHGCFWHAHGNCNVANLPKSRRQYWTAKFARNKQRDDINAKLLVRSGWNVFTVWECETKDFQLLARRLLRGLGPPRAGASKLDGRHGRQ